MTQVDTSYGQELLVPQYASAFLAIDSLYIDYYPLDVETVSIYTGHCFIKFVLNFTDNFF